MVAKFQFLFRISCKLPNFCPHIIQLDSLHRLCVTFGLVAKFSFRPPCRLWREAYFEFRDEIENCLLSVSCLETRTRFCPPNLEPRDEIENFVHRISGLETRSRILFLKSRNSRRDRDFSIILPKHISKSEKKMFPINAQTLQCN